MVRVGFHLYSLLGIPSDMETPELAYSQGISSPLKNRGGQTLPLRTPQFRHNRSDSWAQQDSTFRTRKKHVKTYRIYRTYQNSSIIQRSPLPMIQVKSQCLTVSVFLLKSPSFPLFSSLDGFKRKSNRIAPCFQKTRFYRFTCRCFP